MLFIKQAIDLQHERVLIPEDEGFSASVREFEGCYAYGESANQALQNLEEVALVWIEAQLEKGEEIPRPWNEETYSGRFALRMPKSLHQQLARLADHEGTSLNQYMVSKLSASTGEAQLLKLLDHKLGQQNVNPLPGWNVNPSRGRFFICSAGTFVNMNFKSLGCSTTTGFQTKSSVWEKWEPSKGLLFIGGGHGRS